VRYKIIAIVPSAGLGRRFGPNANKPFQTLKGKPLVIWTLGTLESIDEIAETIPVLKEEDMERGREVFEKYNLSKIGRIAPGGKERQDSVYNGLKLIEDKNCIVLIHDGARPLIEKPLIQETVRHMTEIINAKEDYDGIALGVPIKDTVKEVAGGTIKKTLRRDLLWAAQTPQVFPYQTILVAYEKAMKEGFYSTDDAALVERYGGKVKIMMGSYENIKVTTPEDLFIAEYLLSRSLNS